MTDKMMVSVIIPTMASTQRASMLKRAIESIRRSSRSPIRIITVVNGRQYDEKLCNWLKSQSDVQFDYLETPSLPSAVLKGRELVTSTFFSTLDDDDEFLEGAIDKRVYLMENSPNIDLVLTNGYRNVNGIDAIVYQRLAEVPANSIQTLMDFNWLNSCNALYRASSFEAKYFIDGHPYAEWTWLAYKLAMDNKKILILNEQTFRINDTSGSLSKSQSYQNSYIALFERMLKCAPPYDVAKSIRRKMGAAWHDASNASMNNGDSMEAFKYHLRSLFEPGGFQYLSYSRKFLMPKR